MPSFDPNVQMCRNCSDSCPYDISTAVAELISARIVILAMASGIAALLPASGSVVEIAEVRRRFGCDSGIEVHQRAIGAWRAADHSVRIVTCRTADAGMVAMWPDVPNGGQVVALVAERTGRCAAAPATAAYCVLK